ncbi:hypothetical protein ACHAP8_011282 [Fusarium lateritium]
MASSTRSTAVIRHKRKIDVDLTEASVKNKKSRGAITRDDYTIGWICAMPKELTAAIAMLDQQHSPLPNPPHDNNAYTLGCIGDHNIVIACLPKGMVGHDATANMACHLVNTFPSIKLSLMVGIGSGVPSNKVRLGDVVVGTPSGTYYPGVVRWGFDNEEDKIEQTNTLDDPPQSALTAITRMEAQQNLIGIKIPSYLEELKQKWPNLASKFFRSDKLRDDVFKSTYNHVREFLPDSGEDEDEGEDHELDGCELCDMSMTIKRKPRDMVNHYGLVASGAEIKDATIRNNLNKGLGGKVLCIDTEAAGLMNGFPCLIVRGICDYADSHKNQDWHEHACIVAAAFAKELLQYVHVSDVEKERSVKDVLADVHTIEVDATEITAEPETREIIAETETREVDTETSASITEIRSRQRKDRDKLILDWLTTADYGLQQSRNLSLREPGTGNWFLNTTEFNDWVSTPRQTLLCHGDLGAGKSILTSIVIDHLKSKCRNDPGIGLAYFYCSSKRHDEQNLSQLVASLLRQLVENLSSFPEDISCLHSNFEKSHCYPTLQKLISVLKKVILQYSQVYIIVDALDEFGEAESLRTSFFQLLAQLQRQYPISVLLTFRTDTNITSEVEKEFHNTGKIEIRAPQDDIERFVAAKMHTLPPVVQHNTMLQTVIKDGIASYVDGVFLLAQVYVNLLSYQNSKSDIRDHLKVFTKTKGRDQNGKSEILTKAYKQAMDHIEQQGLKQRSLAKEAIMWLVHAERELTVTELQHALATSELNRAVCEADLPCAARLVAWCAGLVGIDKASNRIGLVHHTMQEYFTDNPEKLLPMTEDNIARTCITYLAVNKIQGQHFKYSCDVTEELEPYPFYHYAANNWGHHVLESSICGVELVSSFRRDRAIMNSFNIVLFTDYSRRKGSDSYDHPSSFQELHLAAYWGLEPLVRILLETKCGVDVVDSLERTPLSYAAEHGHQATTQALLDNMADPNRRSVAIDCDGWTPVSFAAKYGHESVVQLLIEKGAAITQLDLLRAAHRGHEPVVRLLLERDLDINYQPSHRTGHRWSNAQPEYKGRTAISLAAEEGHEAVVRLLLQNGAVPGHEGPTLLSFAAISGNENVVKLLLDANRDELNSLDTNGQTPLCYAARYGHESIVRLLLDSGADVDLKVDNIKEEGEDTDSISEQSHISTDADHNRGRTPLSHAAENGHLSIVEILLARGADPNSQAPEINYFSGMTPLSFAAFRGHTAIVRSFIDMSACLDTAANFDGWLGMTALTFACWFGYDSIVTLLLRAGADPEPPGEIGDCKVTPFSQAASSGHATIERLLLDVDIVQVDFPDDDGRTPLSYMAENGHDENIRLILQKGANVNSDGTAPHNTRTPLSFAAGNGLASTVQLLLNYGANADERCIYKGFEKNTPFPGGMTPLSFAAKYGHERVVQVLLEHGDVDLNNVDDDNRTPLGLAIERGHQAIVQLLLEKGADLEYRFCVDYSDNQMTPLMAAAVYDNQGIARLLIDRGADLDFQDHKEFTALCYAADNNSKEMVRLLLGSGASITPKRRGGPTPLSLTTDIEVARLLIEGGDDVNFKNSEGDTPLFKALQSEQFCRLLIDSGADVNAKDRGGKTPLFLACLWRPQEEVVSLLIRSGANVNFKNCHGRTPLMEAAQLGREEIVRLLLRNGAYINATDNEGNTPLTTGKEYDGVMMALSEGLYSDAEAKVSRRRSRRHR